MIKKELPQTRTTKPIHLPAPACTYSACPCDTVDELSSQPSTCILDLISSHLLQALLHRFSSFFCFLSSSRKHQMPSSSATPPSQAWTLLFVSFWRPSSLPCKLSPPLIHPHTFNPIYLPVALRPNSCLPPGLLF